MAVIGVLTEPTPPTWWKANRHKVYGIGGLLLGYLIGSHLQGTPAQQPQNPRPNHSTPAPTTPSPHRTA
ncbi:hypothetical protein [Streptomyces sp. NBC_01565]|uniref:hypothetical protein n=1 Tax=unclassified Streptomyces TaxID=2593676 RepID=UPI0022550AC5|nr:hypothetical protein [Streptomyces sp. NBC_01565]MCX4546480.1 hypothetical protein [Streptomyces sp. NBC_01565]